MTEASIIGLDLGKNVFQAHGSDAAGQVVFRKRLRRNKVLQFFAAHPPSKVAMEACPGAHHWGREIRALGHDVKLLPPAYVKPFVKRQKNDMADAEAICEALQRPTMRFAVIKSKEQQAAAIAFRARDLLVRQRTQTINALRGHLHEFGVVVPQGPSHVSRLLDLIASQDEAFPEVLWPVLKILSDTLRTLNERISQLDNQISQRAAQDDEAKRLQTIPGIGPITSAAILALAPAPEAFEKGRDFAAWVGLTPLQRSTGGKQILGRTSKMGERTLRRLLIIGASAVVRWAARKGAAAGSWLERMLARKPRMLVTVALANKMARVVWAILAKGGIYKASATAA